MELFEQGKVKLYRGDCMVFLATTPDGYYDLSIVDPPYGIGENAFRSQSRTKAAKTTDWGAFNKTWDKDCPPAEYFSELRRVSKNQIIWGANHMMHHIGKSSPCWLVWDKDNSGCFADCELAYTSFKSAVRLFKYRWNGMIQQEMGNKEERIHPTQKPVALYRWILTNYAKEGNKILDTHLGSGSSAIAAQQFDFDFTGIEIDENYFTAAVDRFKEETKKIQLFRA